MYGIKERVSSETLFLLVLTFAKNTFAIMENNILGGINMITLSILTVIALAIAIVAAVITVMCGAGFIVAFGDIIIAVLIICMIVKLFKGKK